MNDGRITDKVEYGRHISLTCRNHPDLRWSTKNIDFIGARSIFYYGSATGQFVPECSCHASDLIVNPVQRKEGE